ncbi:MAG: DUF2254 domain-containing protein [Candidatus Eremiobacteraeota bacterium]|nr:DUF2254 domain-containing protein [Candidatus Eremiobacteraeota bacterium]
MQRRLPNVPFVALKKITNSLYFLPASLTALSILLAVGLLALDKNFASFYPFTGLWWNDADGAREFLSTSASVAISVVSVSFSVVVVALTLASNQFCPRVLRRFIEDRVNRLVFGTLIGNFAFALVALSALGAKDPPPGMTLMGCFLFDLGSTVLFIYFIHHVSSSLQVDSIVTDLRMATIRQIEDLKESPHRCLGAADTVPHDQGGVCPHGKTGYIQGIRMDRLLELSSEMRQPFYLTCGLGDFVTPSTPALARFRPEPDEELREEILDCFEVDYSRLLDHDISYGIREILDIALKAISPAINDPTTAVMCLQNLTAIYESLAQGGWPRTYLVDESGEGAVYVPNNSPQDYLNLATDQLLYHSPGTPRVAQALLEFLQKVRRLQLGEKWCARVDEKIQALKDAVDSEWHSPVWKKRLAPQSLVEIKKDSWRRASNI